MIEICLYFHCSFLGITPDFSIRLMLFNSELQTPITFLFVNENIKCGYSFHRKNMTNILVTKVFGFAKMFPFCIFSTSFFSGWGIACSLCYQSELPCPIKIGLKCVCGVELCMKLQHSVSRKRVRKIVQYHV